MLLLDVATVNTIHKQQTLHALPPQPILHGPQLLQPRTHIVSTLSAHRQGGKRKAFFVDLLAATNPPVHEKYSLDAKLIQWRPSRMSTSWYIQFLHSYLSLEPITDFYPSSSNLVQEPLWRNWVYLKPTPQPSIVSQRACFQQRSQANMNLTEFERSLPKSLRRLPHPMSLLRRMSR